MDGQKDLNYHIVQKVFIDLDNTLLPFDTLWSVWKAILVAGLRPHLTKVTLHLGFQSIPKSLMASCFSDMPFQEYKAFFSDLARIFASDIDPSVKCWSEGLVSDKSHIHILTGSFLPLATGISDHLGWGRSIGTDLEVRSGRLTGKLSTPAIKGDQKIKAIKQVFKIRDNHFRFLAAAGDSYGDRYLMEKCSLRYFPQNASRRLIRYFASK
jgi:HAD superfamily phosphoserine phosphatase-like hydrolase